MKAMGQVHLRNQISVLEQFDIGRPSSMTAVSVAASDLTRGWNGILMSVPMLIISWCGRANRRFYTAAKLM